MAKLALHMRPNILWIVFDTARADALEPYGAPVVSTPVVADLARRGDALRDVRSTACWTLPAHVSMFAGGLPRELGFADQSELSPHTARPIVQSLRERLIADVLTRSGYSTSGVSTNAWVSGHSGFATGFERFVDTFTDTGETRPAKMGSPSPGARIRWMVEVARARVDDGARDAERTLDAWISEGPAEPFFWFVNLVECHSPYLPPKPYTELPLLGRIRAGEEARVILTMAGIWRACVTGRIPPSDALERMRVGYRSAVRYMDDWLGRLLERLDASGLLEHTLVMVSSDHGENFGEGRLIGHSFSLDERLINVPFVVAGPGADRMRGLRSFVELPGRLAAIAGLADHPYDPEDFPPLPVAQLDAPVPPRGDPRTEQVITTWGLDETAAERLTTPMTAVVDGTVKLILRGEAETFYDLKGDPLETSPVDPGRLDPASVSRLRGALTHQAVMARETRLDRSTAPAPELTEDERAEIEDRLRMLGYL
jgi:arylsulfatase A-like enzyme